MNRTRHPLRHPIALLLFFGTTVVGLALDLLLKSWAVMRLKDQPAVELIPGWLRLTYTENFGAVFGLGQGYWPIFVVVSIGAIIFLTYLFLHSQQRHGYQFLLGLLLAGVLGNMYDRIMIGHVRDMIYALPGKQWPMMIYRHLPNNLPRELFPWIFNLADSMLCVGVFLMLVYSVIHDPEKKDAVEMDRP